MAIYTLCSAGGSPGVTSTVLAMAAVWPRPVVVVEADPTGGSAILAGFYRGVVDQPGLIQLAMAHRQGQLASSLPALLHPIADTQAHLLAGTRSHDQAVGLEGVWQPLLEVLRDLDGNGQDVLVDAGRLGLDGSPMPLILGADATAVLVGSNLPAVSAARSWTRTVRDRVAAQLGVVLVGPGRPYSGREVAAALEVALWGAIDWAPTSAAVFSDGADYPPATGLKRLAGRRATREAFVRSPYLRGVSSVAETLRRSASAHSVDIGGVPFTQAQEASR